MYVSARYDVAQFDDKLILVNGVDRNLVTTDVSAFDELVPLIRQGEAEATATAHDKLQDSRITDWVTETDVVENDLLFNVTTSAGALITNVGSAALTHQPLTAASPGFMSGNAAKAGGDRYQIRDLVELNIIPTGGVDPDNIALAGNGSSATRTQVSALNGRVNFANTEVAAGDFIRNTTRNNVARITGVSGNEIQHTTFGAAYTSGDSLVFLKYAMPIAETVHVHYDRAYFIDARDRSKVRISGPGDPQDMTTDAATLDSTTFRTGAQQPVGDIAVGMVSFQQWFVIAGNRYVALFTGTDPIADSASDSVSFAPVSLFPQGVISKHGLLTVGNDLIFLTPDGLESASLEGSDTIPTRRNLSDGIRQELQKAMDDTAAENIRLSYYPKRDWLFAKSSSALYCFNFIGNLGLESRKIAEVEQGGSWHVISGRMANMNDFFVNNEGDPLVCDSSGRVFEFDDSEAAYTDGGEDYTYTFRSPFYGLDEGNRGVGYPSRKVKKGVAFIPTIETSVDATFNFSATASFSGETSSTETIAVEVSGSSRAMNSPRIPLTWRGEQVRFGITGTAKGHTVFGGYTVLFNTYGIRHD